MNRGENKLHFQRQQYLPIASLWCRTRIGWNQSGIFLVKMGMASEAPEYHKQKPGNDTTRRFPISRGPNYYGIPDLNQGGAGMIGQQEMLMQCFGDQILLLPACPKEVDVDFKLHAPKQTLVELSFNCHEGN